MHQHADLNQQGLSVFLYSDIFSATDSRPHSRSLDESSPILVYTAACAGSVQECRPRTLAFAECNFGSPSAVNGT